MLNFNEIIESNQGLTLFAAFFGAFIGWFFTIFTGYFSAKVNNKTARAKLKILVENNLMRIKANKGIIENEIARLGPYGKMTMTPLSALIDYDSSYIHNSTKFNANELATIEMQIAALNSHQSQVNDLLCRRAELEIHIRKEFDFRVESELSGLRLEYNHYLQKKYQEIEKYARILNMSLSMSFLTRTLIYSPTCRGLIKLACKLFPQKLSAYSIDFSELDKFKH